MSSEIQKYDTKYYVRSVHILYIFIGFLPVVDHHGLKATKKLDTISKVYIFFVWFSIKNNDYFSRNHAKCLFTSTSDLFCIDRCILDKVRK